ncbi:MAG: ABC transporter ATP-binding protein [Casimicrobiaceae bacterium]
MTVETSAVDAAHALDRANTIVRGSDKLLVRLSGIVKAFPNVLANAGIDLELCAGEIHGLLGENGSGKSTLMKILYGIYQPDAGSISISGRQVVINSPRDAVRHGIGMVHQHFMLVPSLTVVENLMLGIETRRGLLLDREPIRRKTKELFERTGLSPVSLDARTDTLSVGEQQRVEILKALLRGAKTLVLDEPTAVLTPQEAERLGEMLLQLRHSGYGIVLITHKLDEVTAFCDWVTVLRQGKNVASRPARGISKQELATLMVGRKLTDVGLGDRAPSKEVLLALDGVTVHSRNGKGELDGVSLAVHSGEILGIAGVAGNGQGALAEVLVGLRRIDRGTIRVGGVPADDWNVRRAIREGVGYIPEDRQCIGLVLNLSVEENLVLKSIERPRFSTCGVIRFRFIRQHADELIKAFDVRPSIAISPVRWLSGGNQQKVILARELAPENRIIVAAEPTRGLDVGSVDYIHRTLVRQRDKGSGIVLISTDLDEVLRLSDRVAVLYAGKVVKVLERRTATREVIGLFMAGGSEGN